MSSSQRLRVGVALEGAGWHPASWREASSRPEALFTAEYWVELVRLAEAGLLDFVTIEDSLALQSSELFRADERTDEVRGRLDALLIASRVSPVTSHIGLIPTVTTTHTEPFHVSKGIATLDYTSEGRAGWQVKVSGRADEAAHIGRREHPGADLAWDDPAFAALVTELFDEAADVVEVVRRLWDSWEDDAEIRDVATDRFLDAAKVHQVDFEGRWFSVRGPAITPRPPQGQPVVAALAHAEVPYRLAARSADVVFVTPADDHARAILAEVAAAQRTEGRDGEALKVFADLVVFLDQPGGESAEDRLRRLNGLGRALTSDARIFTGSAGELADLIAAWGELGYAGVRLRPGVVTDDLPRIAEDVTAELRRRGLFHDEYESDTLRGLLGLPEGAPSRYATASVA
jgi:alkanesulfonate monooxygenase SsuD/methylene tetrahydromethanopterin reductase-like flavin-dependent oxidoreductase (luciferase family)